MSSSRFHRLRELFDAASDLPAAERAAFLEQACGDDHDVRREVLSLLTLDRADNPLFEKGLLGLHSGLSERDKVGPYQVVRELGRGGMGVVYLAEDTRLNRQVALKAIHPAHQGDEKQRERFRREAGVAASLSHPGIATIYALEEWNASQYIVAEYVPGSTLADEFERGPLDANTALDMGIQLAAAVAAAHAKGVVHRDLKPHNIIRNPNGQLKILDFGLAVAFAAESGDHARLTQSGALLGTPAYMAPEQLLGEATDFRSDLFAVGIILAEAVTGEHPFSGSNLPVTMAAILAREPRGLNSLRNQAPRLESVIRRCLQKEPGQRYQSATELHAKLRQLAETGRQTAPEPSASRPGARVGLHWWLVHQIAVTLSCILLTSALWQVSVWADDAITRLTFIGGLGVASVIVTLRLHLIFTSRHNRTAILSELSRVTPWLQRADWAFTVLLVVAALDLALERRLYAALLVGFAAAYATVFLFTEPATRSAVFGEAGTKH